MNLKEIVAKITFSKTANGMSKAVINMPVELRKGKDNKIYIKLNLLGDITTFAENESDIDKAIGEAIQSFFIAASFFGKGVKDELEKLGWQIKKNSVRFKDRPALNNARMKKWKTKSPISLTM